MAVGEKLIHLAHLYRAGEQWMCLTCLYLLVKVE